MSDQLDQLTDAELSERVAVECAGWTNVDTYLGNSIFSHSFRGGTNDGPPDGEDTIGHKIKPIPPFSISNDAIMPIIESARDKGRRVDVLMGFKYWHVTIHEKQADGKYAPPVRAIAPTLPRAFSLALLRAARAEKGQP